MERGNTKHGPAHDQEMAHETEGIVRGAPKPPHSEEWRQPEPVEEMPVQRDRETAPAAAGEDIELRNELARLVSRDVFPAGRDELVAVLRDRDASGPLISRVERLPGGRRFGGAHEVMTALGINAPEQRPGQ